MELIFLKIGNCTIKGIIFDLDGTLFDSCDLWHKIDIAFFKEHNLELPLDYSENVAHLAIDKVALYTKERFGLKESVEDIQRFWDEMALKAYEKEVELKPHVKAYLNYLKENNITLAIATANQTKYYMPCLERHNITDYFSHIYDVNTFNGGKDSPEIYLQIANDMGYDLKEIAVFEDIPRALKTAKDAGFYTVAVHDNTQDKLKDLKADIADKYIYSYEELYD